MANVYDRDAKEALISKVLGREFNRARLLLLGLIPELEAWMVDVAPEFWAEHRTNLVGGVTPLLSSVYIAQATTMLEEFDFLGVEWGLVNEAAVEWAKAHTYNLVGELNKTSQRYLGKEIERIQQITRELQTSISDYFANPTNLAQLRDSLTPTFGPVRAEMIARTEVTRAASEGERETTRQLEAMGIKMWHIWQTRNDEIVAQCPICWPKHGKKIGVDIPEEYPPGHPRCRCWWTQEIIPIE